jgi:Septum formation initiator.
VGKLKDIFNSLKGEENDLRRSFFKYAICTTALFVVLVGFVNKNNVVRWVKAGIEIRHQEKRMQVLEGEIKVMDEQIHALTSSKDSLEKYAREEFGFAAPGDDVFVVEEKQ